MSEHPGDARPAGYAESSRTAVLAAMAANLTIAITKFLGWILTGASSMLAEAIHSVADTANQILLLVGGRTSQQAADEEHPFGFGRRRYVSAFMVAVILFTLGGLFALYEAYEKFHQWRAGHPDQLLESRWWWVPLLVLAASIVAEGLSLRTAMREATPTRGGQSWGRFIRTAKAPELPVVLLEDSAALVGLLFALFGVGMTLITHNPVFDVIGTALIGLLLIAVALTLGIEVSSLLVGESASPEAVDRIHAALVATPGVLRIIHSRTLHLGPDEVLLAAKVAVEPTDGARRVAEIIDAAERRIRAAEPSVTLIYLEPDVDRGEPGDGGISSAPAQDR